MKRLSDNSIDSIVTDPPYELGFMNKKWDKTGIAYNTDAWKEALRVLKPGGYLLSFGGTRTYHRMACAIEDAGFIKAKFFERFLFLPPIPFIQLHTKPPIVELSIASATSTTPLISR